MYFMERFNPAGEYRFRLDGSRPAAKPAVVRTEKLTRFECHRAFLPAVYVWAIGPTDARWKAENSFSNPCYHVCLAINQFRHVGDVF